MFTAKPVFIHIGLPKTGTTALQHNVFGSCPSTRYAGKPYREGSADERRLIRSITELDQETWNTRLDRTFRCAAGLFGGTEDRVLLSEEEFSVGSLNGKADRERIGRRLHLLFPRAKVLVVLRNQLTLLPSLYGYALGLTGVPYVPFNVWLEDVRSTPSGGRGLYLLDYSQLLDLYAGLFGRENVEVLFYEELLAEYPVFVRRLAKILDVDVEALLRLPNRYMNMRPSLRMLQAMKFGERHRWAGGVVAALPGFVRRRLEERLAQGPKLDNSYSPENEAAVRAHYAQSNRRVCAVHHVDLASLGYPVE